MWQKYKIHHEHTFLHSSVVKSEPVWLHPQEMRLKAQKQLLSYKYLLNYQMKATDENNYLHIFHFQANVHLCFHFPLS